MTDVTEQEIRDGERMTQFLTDPVVQDSIKHLRDRYYDDFKSSTSPERRNDAWACARVIDDFENELRAVAESGALARARLEKQQR